MSGSGTHLFTAYGVQDFAPESVEALQCNVHVWCTSPCEMAGSLIELRHYYSTTVPFKRRRKRDARALVRRGAGPAPALGFGLVMQSYEFAELNALSVPALFTDFLVKEEYHNSGHFGSSGSIDGQTMVIGAYYDEVCQAGIYQSFGSETTCDHSGAARSNTLFCLFFKPQFLLLC